MAEMLLNWASDRFASSDIIDLYFVVSDLIDIPLTEDELSETAYFDAFSSHSAEDAFFSHTSEFRNSNGNANIPIGKLSL